MSFTVAGISKNKGKLKVRFCTDLVLRVKNLQKQGDTDIKLIELPNVMDKVDACKYLIAHPSFQVYNTDIKAILNKKAASQISVA